MACLIHYASKFVLMDGKLMCWDLQGCHKVVIPKEKQFSLISQAHEVVGHRVIFSTLSNLWERFWWPMLDEDVKQFSSTFHPCQTQQTHHLPLPPTILTLLHFSTRFTSIPCLLSISFAILSRTIVPCPLGPSGGVFRSKMRRLLEPLFSRISCSNGVEWLKLLLTMAPHL